MDTRRVILYTLLFLFAYLLFINWQQDYPKKAAPAVALTESTALKNDAFLPSPLALQEETATKTPTPTTTTEALTKPSVESQPIVVRTDVLNVHIDPLNGDLVFAQLLQYPLSLEEKETPFTLLNPSAKQRYVANSSLFTRQGMNAQNLHFNFSSAQQNYVLEKGQDSLVVTLEGQSDEGLTVKKHYTFTRGSYLVDVAYEITNNTENPWQGYMNTQLLRSEPPEDKSSMFQVGSYTGGSYSTSAKQRYEKMPFPQMEKSDLNAKANGGWIALQQHYFLSAWVPPADAKSTLYTRVAQDNYMIGAISSPIVVQPASQASIHSRLYIGPEITDTLKAIAPGLDLTVDYGWLWFVSSLLFSLMKAIHGVVGNWGWSIILVTLFIKLAFYRLSATSYKSMANMRKIQPKLQALRERYPDDKAKLSQATMELYRQEKVNPLGGCLPILIQIPVFIALYWVLIESVQLRQAPFFGWIHDLAAADPYHILPILMGGTMVLQQRLNPAPPDPMQARVMMLLPVLFTVLFWNFPAGLVLYWVVNNALSILQQWYITKKYGQEDKPKKLFIPAK